MKKISSFILFLFIIFGLSNISYANFTYDNQVEVMIIGDAETEEIYFSKGEDLKLPVASMSKLMTYYIVMDEVDKGNISLEDDVIITSEASKLNIPGYSRFKLNEGESVKVKDLLVGMMVVSGNDAANALAIHVAGDLQTFVNIMNQKAKELGLENSSFVNPSGLTERDKSTQNKDTSDNTSSEENDETSTKLIYNEMSGKDLFKLAHEILSRFPQVEEYGKMDKVTYPERSFSAESTLPLQSNPAMIGLKTGTTEEAGYGFTGLFDMSLVDKDKDYKLITVVSGGDTPEMRVTTTQELLDYLSNNFSYKTLLNTEVPVVEIADDSTKARYIPLYSSKEFKKMIPAGEEVDISYEIDETKKAPYENGEKLGEIILNYNGSEIERADLITKDNYPKVSFFEKISQSIKEFFDNLILLF